MTSSVLLILDAMVQFDDHPYVVGFGPALEEHEIGDIESETNREFWGDPQLVHWDFQFFGGVSDHSRIREFAVTFP